MTDHPVPTIDIEPWRRGGEAERDSVAGAVDAACRETGFFAIAGHGVAEATIDDLRARAVEFFALPDERKRRVERPADRVSRGWNALRDRSLAYSLGKDTPPDLQESFAMGPVAVPDEPYFTCDRARAFFAPNIWPEGRAGVPPGDGRLFYPDGGFVAYGDADLRPRARPRRRAFRRQHRPPLLQPQADPLPRPRGRRASGASAGPASITITARSPSCAATICRAGSRSSCAMAAGSTWSGRRAGSSAISATP